MKRRHALAVLLSAGIAPLQFAHAAPADASPLTIVVPFVPGAATDALTRLISQQWTNKTGRMVIVENRPGSNGIIAADAVKRVAPDGRTLLLSNFGSNAVNYSLYSKLPYSERDFTPVTLLFRLPSLLVVPAASPARTAQELVALAKRSPQGLLYGSAGSGSGAHLLAELMKSMTQMPATHVPYRGVAPAVVDLVAGRIDFMFSSYSSVQKLVEAGQLRVLAAATSKRLPALPNVPTMKEAGLSEQIVMDQWFGLSAPANTPADVVAALHAQFAEVLRDPAIVQRMNEQGVEAVSATPAEFAALIKADTERLGRLVKAVGASAD